jgi:hypothetical protein
MVQEEIGLGVHAARYFATGRNAFVLSPGLNQSLLHTDLTGLKFSDIHFPFRSFYLGFAGPIDASLPGSDNFIDGGYVCDLGSVIEILLTTRRYNVDPSNSKRWPWSRDPYFYVPFEPGDSEGTIENALTRLLKTRKIDIEPRDFIPDAVPMDLESTGFENAPFEVFDVTARNDAIDAARNIEALPSVRRALSLLLNAIAYMTAEPEDVPETGQWPEDAPGDLVQKAMSRRSGERKQAHSELRQQGYTAIKVLGRNIPVQPIDHVPSSSGERGAVSPHWRRGHYRAQRFGPGFRDTRNTWIRPVWVRHDLGSPPKGHLYMVDERPPADNPGHNETR